jgi:hypothetical protein
MTTELRVIETAGMHLETFADDTGEKWVAMRPIVEAMGLHWGPQHKKLGGEGGMFSCRLMATTGSDGKRYEMVCIPLHLGRGFLVERHPRWHCCTKLGRSASGCGKRARAPETTHEAAQRVRRFGVYHIAPAAELQACARPMTKGEAICSTVAIRLRWFAPGWPVQL